jgi:raffinose/stachyose/melibiose transport system permease protein
MINNQIGLIFIYVATGVSFSFFLLSGFLNTIPKEMDESAKIDGAGYVRIFLSILLPVIKPGLATVATFSFLHSWNEFLFGLIMITGERKMTITVGIDTLKGMYTTQYGLLCAGLMFAIVPMVIIYILLQEHVIKGVTAGAVKG